MKIIILCVFIVNLNAEVDNSTKTLSLNVSTNTTSVVKTSNNDYISDTEFNEILSEAEKKLKMEKDKKGRLVDYFFELLNIKRAMYPHEAVKAAMNLDEFRRKYPDKYLALMNKEIELNPQNSLARYERALVYQDICYKKIRESKDLDDFFKEQKCLLKVIDELKDVLKYVKDTDTTVDRVPLKFGIYYQIGLAYENLEDFNKAITYYSKAIDFNHKDNAKSPELYEKRAEVYLKMGKIDMAIEDLKNFHKEATTPPGAWSEKSKKNFLLSTGICKCLYFKGCPEYRIPKNFEFDNKDGVCPSKEEVIEWEKKAVTRVKENK